MTTRRVLGVFCAVCALTWAGACGRSVDSDAFARALAPALERHAARDRTVASAVQAFYQQRDNQPSWIDDGVVNDAAAAIARSSAHGLVPDDYDAAAFVSAQRAAADLGRTDPVRTDALAALDVMVTTALVRAGRDVALGRAAPAVVGAQWPPRLTPVELGTSLAAAWRDGQLASWLDGLAPPHAGYNRLREALARLQAATPQDPRQIAIVQLNLDRWRWLPNDLGDRYLMANIPEFLLRAKEGDRTAFEMRVVVGEPGEHETPLFSDVMETVVFNPYWHIPKSIAAGETVPAILKDHDYLSRHDIEVLDARQGHRPIDPDDVDWDDADEVKTLVFRQRPGEDNALGDVKFLFPNRNAVYMHDTPSTALFGRQMRALSHGCVRLAEPRKLAEYVLGGQAAWTTETIATTMAGDEEKHVKLGQPVPVHLVYFTVSVNDRGDLAFFDDIYKLDQKILQSGRRPKL